MSLKKYRVEVREIYRCYVDVEATSADEAQAIAERQVEDSDVVVLDSYDHLDREFTARRHPDEIMRQIEETGLVIDPSDR